MPKLSIIIPTYNSGRCIERCLRSIACQTFRDYEVIVQDGGSADGTLEKIARLRLANASASLRIFSGRDKGTYDAMNKAVRRAKGEWLYFLGSDDELHDHEVLAGIFEGLDLTDSDVVYGNVQLFGSASWAEGNPIYGGPFSLERLLGGNICHQAIFYRAKFFKMVGQYNINYALYADWDFNMRCWTRTRFRYVDVVIADFSSDGISSTRQDERFKSEVASNVLRYFNVSLWHPALNVPAFPGFTEIARMKKSSVSLGRAASRIRRTILPRTYG